MLIHYLQNLQMEILPYRKARPVLIQVQRILRSRVKSLLITMEMVFLNPLGPTTKNLLIPMEMAFGILGIFLI